MEVKSYDYVKSHLQESIQYVVNHDALLISDQDENIAVLLSVQHYQSQDKTMSFAERWQVWHNKLSVDCCLDDTFTDVRQEEQGRSFSW